MKLMSQTKSVFGGTDFWKKNEWALAVALLITGFFTATIIPFTRKDFGERYFGWLNIYFGYSTMTAYIVASTMLGAFIHVMPSRLMTILMFAFIGSSLYHRWEIRRKNNSGVHWHSNFMGTSLLPFPYSQEKIFKFFEPLSVFLLGYTLYHLISGQVGIWLMVAAASLFINNHIIFHQERQAILDMRDAQIEAQYFGDALAGKPAAQTAGFVVSESSIKLVGQDAGLTQAFAELSDEMKSLLDVPPDLKAQGIA